MCPVLLINLKPSILLYSKVFLSWLTNAEKVHRPCPKTLIFVIFTAGVARRIRGDLILLEFHCQFTSGVFCAWLPTSAHRVSPVSGWAGVTAPVTGWNSAPDPVTGWRSIPDPVTGWRSIPDPVTGWRSIPDSVTGWRSIPDPVTGWRSIPDPVIPCYWWEPASKWYRYRGNTEVMCIYCRNV